MLRFSSFITLLLLVSVPYGAQSRDMQLDGNILLADFDAGGSDDFSSGNALNLQYSYYLKSWLAADVGLLVSEKVLDGPNEDIVGTYRAGLQTNTLLLGVKPRYKFSSPYEIYGRIGLQVWRTELEIEEYFNDSTPEGRIVLDDTGTGYYFGLGGAHYVTDNVMVTLEVRQLVQLDVFAGESNYPFDLTITALSLGVGYRF